MTSLIRYRAQITMLEARVQDLRDERDRLRDVLKTLLLAHDVASDAGIVMIEKALNGTWFK